MAVPWQVYPNLPRRMPQSMGFSRYGLSFDGINDRVEVVDADSLDVNNVTVMLWIKQISSSPPETAIIKNRGGPPRYPFILGTWADWGSNWGGGFYDGAWHTVDMGATLTLDVWYHTALTYDGSQLRLYVNGILEDTLNYVGVLPVTTGDLYINSDPGLARWLEAIIDEVCIYNRALSAQEIRDNMLNYHRPIRTGLVLLLRMEEGTGLTIADQSGNGNNGNLLPVANPPMWRRNQQWELRAEAGL